MRQIFLTLAFLLFTVQVWAATYNIGPGQTYETFTALEAAVVLAGDDVVDGGGNTFYETWTPATSGTSGHPITFQNAVIDGEDTRDYCFRSTRSYIILDNITATRARLEGVSVYRGTDVTVQNCTAYNHQYASNYPAGLRFFGTTNAVVDNCTFYNIRWNGVQYTSQLAAGDVSGVQVTDSTFYDVDHSSIDIKAYPAGDVTDILISKNSIRGTGIYMEHTDTKTISDVTLSYNVILDTTTHGISGQTRTGMGYTETAFDDFEIYHNTISRSGLTNIGYNLRFVDGLTNSTIYNNVFNDANVSNTGSHTGSIEISDTVSGTVIDYTAYGTLYTGSTVIRWNGSDYSTISAFNTASSQDANSIITNPLLLSSGKLRTGSPALDAGVEISGVNDGGEEDIWGNAADTDYLNMGAYFGYGMVRRPQMLSIGGGFDGMRFMGTTWRESAAPQDPGDIGYTETWTTYADAWGDNYTANWP